MTRPLLDKTSSFLSSLLNSIDTEGPVEAPGAEVTPYWSDNSPEKRYLTDRHPDVVAVAFLAWEFAQLINNRNFNSLDGRVEYHLYTDDYLQEMDNKKDERTTVKYLKKYKLKTHCQGSQIRSMKFDGKMNKVEVISSVSIVVDEATDKFFKVMNKGREGKVLAKGVCYDQLYKLNMFKGHEGWKVSNFELDSAITVHD